MKSLKTATLIVLALFMTISVNAQKDKSKRKSPPAQVSKEIDGTKVTIDYSRPAKKGREIFGSLEAYGKVWRTGANETTWIEFSDDVVVEGKKLAAGKYGLFTIPGKDEWTIIFNNKWDGWGAYEYKESNDVLRVKASSTMTDSVVEMLTIDITDSGDVAISWDQTKVTFSVR